MKLDDLGDLSRATLRAIGALNGGTRTEIAEQSGLTKQQTSSALSRLWNFQLVTEPLTYGGTWAITNKGVELLLYPHDDRTVLPVPEPPATPEPEPELEPDPEMNSADPVDEVGLPTQFVPDALLRSREIEDALALVRARLHCTLIPAIATRVYFQVVDGLPPVLREELLPITRLVASGSE